MKATDRAATGASSATRLALATLAAACMAGAQAQPVAANPAAAGVRPIYDGHLCCNMRTDGSWISDSNYAEGGKRVIPAGTLVKVTGYGRQRVQVTVDGKQQAIGNDYSRDIATDSQTRNLMVMP